MFVSGYVFNVFLAFPGLLLAIAMVAFLGAGLNKLILALCIIGWVGYARLIRGQVLKVREYDFVQAARALGASDARILLYSHSCRMRYNRSSFKRVWEWPAQCSRRRRYLFSDWGCLRPRLRGAC